MPPKRSTHSEADHTRSRCRCRLGESGPRRVLPVVAARRAVVCDTSVRMKRQCFVSTLRTIDAATRTGRRRSTAVQAEAESDPACAGHNEIDAKEQAKDIEARDRPVRQNEQAKPQRDRTGQQYPDPGRFLLHAEGENDPHDARGQQRCAENEREQCGGSRCGPALPNDDVERTGRVAA
jgi:hypothetical protein